MNNEKITAILSEYTEVPQADITPDKDLIKDLELTSLDVLDLIAAFEDTFDVEISDADVKSFHTVKDIENWLQANAG